MSDTATVANTAPVANEQAVAINQDTVFNGTLTPTDADTADTLTYSKVTDPAHGSVMVNAGGSFSYTPTAGYDGSDPFTFKVNDGTADSNSEVASDPAHYKVTVQSHAVAVERAGYNAKTHTVTLSLPESALNRCAVERPGRHQEPCPGWQLWHPDRALVGQAINNTTAPIEGAVVLFAPN